MKLLRECFMLSRSMMSRETAGDERKCLGPHNAATYYPTVHVLAVMHPCFFE